MMKIKMTCRLEATYEQSALLEINLSQFLAGLPHDVPPQAAYDIWLAVHETFINIVEHAYACPGGMVWLTAVWQEEKGAVEIELRDSGRAFALERFACPDPNLLQEGGYGLYLARQLVDTVTYTVELTENSWRLTKYLPGPFC